MKNDKDRRIVSILSGGLGNQYFQYLYAKNISLVNNISIKFNETLINLDFRYKTKFFLRINKNKDKFFDSLFILFFLIFKKFKIIKIMNQYQFFNNLIICDFENKKIKNLENMKIDKFKRIYLLGYFQCEDYFIENKIKLIEHIKPIEKDDRLFQQYIHNFNPEKAVFVGLRFYEEAGKHKKNFGGIENELFYYNCINNFKKKIKDPKFYFFSTVDLKKNKLINYPKNSVIIDRNVNANTFETLYFISMFKNFIISNSTFYWWGAYFAEMKYKKIKIISSKNFINKHIIPKRWMGFN